MSSPPPGRGSAFKHCCKGVELSIQRSHLGAFLFGWHWDIGDVYIDSGLTPVSPLLQRYWMHPADYEADLKNFLTLVFFGP